MFSKIGHPWEDSKTKGDVKAKNPDNGYRKPTVSDEAQKLALNCYEYFCKSTPKKYGTLTVFFLGDLQAGACNLNKKDFFCKKI